MLHRFYSCLISHKSIRLLFFNLFASALLLYTSTIISFWLNHKWNKVENVKATTDSWLSKVATMSPPKHLTLSFHPAISSIQGPSHISTPISAMIFSIPQTAYFLFSSETPGVISTHFYT